MSIVTDVAESLKPWLDRELYNEVERVKKDTVVSTKWKHIVRLKDKWV